MTHARGGCQRFSTFYCLANSCPCNFLRNSVTFYLTTCVRICHIISIMTTTPMDRVTSAIVRYFSFADSGVPSLTGRQLDAMRSGTWIHSTKRDATECRFARFADAARPMRKLLPSELDVLRAKYWARGKFQVSCQRRTSTGVLVEYERSCLPTDAQCATALGYRSPRAFRSALTKARGKVYAALC